MRKKILLCIGILLAVSLWIALHTISAAGAEEYETLYVLEDVNLSSMPAMEGNALSLVLKGSAVSVTEYNEDGWSRVFHEGGQGFIKSEFLGTQQQTIAGIYYALVNVYLRSEAAADSDALQLVQFASAVEVAEYDAEGWSRVSVDGNTGFIKSEFLGTEIQLEEAKESGTSAVELTPWSEARYIMTIGAVAKITDVRSGITYNVKSFSNGKHADVQPVTKEDVALMKRTFGGRWSWTARPVWVSVNGRTMAASINGMPHSGGVSNGNGLKGHMCLHYKGSATHNGNASYTRLNQNAVNEAYRAAKS